MIRLGIMIILVLSSVINVPAQTKEDIHTVVITFTTYSSNSSYATERWRFLYKKKGVYYELDGINPGKDVPKVIKSRIIDQFYHRALNSRRHLCRLLSFDIKEKDYKNYLNGISSYIEDDYRLLLPYMANKISLDALRSFKAKDFELPCQELQVLLTQPELMYYTPFVKIEFIGDNSSINLSPYSFYEGTPWIIHSNSDKLYMEYHHVYRFLKKIDYDRFITFFDKSILMYEIALAVLLSK